MLDVLPYNVTESVCRLLSFADLKKLGAAQIGGFFPLIAHETQIRRFFRNCVNIVVPRDASADVRMLVYRDFESTVEAVDLQSFSSLDVASRNTLVIAASLHVASPRRFSESSSKPQILDFVSRFARIPHLRLIIASGTHENPFFNELLCVLRANLHSPSLLVLSSPSLSPQLLEIVQQTFQSSALRRLRANVDSTAFQKSLLDFIANGDWQKIHIDSQLPFSFFDTILSAWKSNRFPTKRPRMIKFGKVFSNTINPNRDYDIPHPRDENLSMRVCMNYVDDSDLRLMIILIEFENFASPERIDHGFFLRSTISAVINS